MQIKRFFCVSVVGVAVDIAVAYAVVLLLAAPLWLAAAAGFTAAAAGNYILHEVWTFRREGAPSLSITRAFYYFVSSGFTLLSRLAVVAWLSIWVPRDHALAILVGGAAVSFFVNYLISKFFVFSKRVEN